MDRSFATSMFGMACCFCLAWKASPVVLEPPALTATSVAPAASVAQAVAARAEPELAAAAPRESRAVNVVDVAAAAATPELIGEVIRLAPGERVTSIDDRAVSSDLAAGSWIGARFQDRAIGADGIGPIRAGDFIDVTIEGEAHSRRVLVLFH